MMMTPIPPEQRISVRDARRQRGLRPEDVASRTGAAISTIRNIEAGRQSPSINLAQKIADALGVHVCAIDWRTQKDKEREEVSESEPQDQPQAEH